MPVTLGILKNRGGGLGRGAERHTEESAGLGDRLEVGRGSRQEGKGATKVLPGQVPGGGR